MTTEQVHTCSYYCDRPECLKDQRDELRDRLDATPPAQAAEAVERVAEAMGAKGAPPSGEVRGLVDEAMVRQELRAARDLDDAVARIVALSRQPAPDKWTTEYLDGSKAYFDSEDDARHRNESRIKSVTPPSSAPDKVRVVEDDLGFFSRLADLWERVARPDEDGAEPDHGILFCVNELRSAVVVIRERYAAAALAAMQAGEGQA